MAQDIAALVATHTSWLSKRTTPRWRGEQLLTTIVNHQCPSWSAAHSVIGTRVMVGMNLWNLFRYTNHAWWSVKRLCALHKCPAHSSSFPEWWNVSSHFALKDGSPQSITRMPVKQADWKLRPMYPGTVPLTTYSEGSIETYNDIYLGHVEKVIHLARSDFDWRCPQNECFPSL